MEIKVQVPMFHYKAGDVLTEKNQHYKTFALWAKNKDRKYGQEICSFIGNGDANIVEGDVSDVVSMSEMESAKVVAKVTIENCFEADGSVMKCTLCGHKTPKRWMQKHIDEKHS